MQLTTNSRAFIESEQYSEFVLLNLHDGLLPDSYYRNVSDFGNGTTLHIKTIGTVTLQEAAEDTPLIYNPIESGEIQLTISQYKGDAWYVTDDLREDGTNVDLLIAQRASEGTRAFQEIFETDFLAIGAKLYAASNTAFNVNGFAHKIVSAAGNNIFQLSHLIKMRLAFDKANVPAEGRIFLCDPVVEATLNGLVNITSQTTPFAAGILENGLAKNHKFLMNLYGWDIITSNRLYVYGPSQTDGTTSLAGGVMNMFMCIADDQTKPIMLAWRRMPKSEGERNKDRARDEHVMRARYGFGVQRTDTMGCLVTSATAIA